MSLKNVVKVMNFHSLLRVDKSRKSARKYSQIEEMVLDMLDNILNNRNILLDYKILKVDTSKPSLVIMLGSDLGFCGNLNNLVRKEFGGINQSSTEMDPDLQVSNNSNIRTVVIGRKIKGIRNENTLIYQSREEFVNNHEELTSLITNGIFNKDFSSVRLIYNHYRNTSEVEFVDKVIFPMPKGLLGNKEYKEDFICEGDMQELLANLLAMYVRYELEIAAEVSLAAENINRQSITTDSLKKIDEREEERIQAERREFKDKEFAKVLDNYTKLRHY